MKNIVWCFVVLLASCGGNTNTVSIDNYKEIKIEHSIVSQKIETIDIDTVFVNNIGSISGDGFWKYRQDTLYYFDRMLAVVDVYNCEGIFQHRSLGIGRGPGEVLEEIGTVCSFDSGWLPKCIIYIGSQKCFMIRR